MKKLLRTLDWIKPSGRPNWEEIQVDIVFITLVGILIYIGEKLL